MQSERDHLDLTPGAATTVAAEDIFLEHAHRPELSSKEEVVAGEDGKEVVEEDKEAGREEEAISNNRHKDRKQITSPRRSKSEPPRLRTLTRTKHPKVLWNVSTRSWPRPVKKKETELRS